MATTFSTTNLCGLAAAATPRARRARQHQTYPVRHINSSGLDAVKLSGSRGSHTRNAVGGGVSGGSLVEQGGFFNDCSRAASAAGVGVAACNSGNGVGGAREARTLRKRESRSAYQRREAAAGAVDGEGESDSPTVRGGEHRGEKPQQNKRYLSLPAHPAGATAYHTHRE